MTNLLKALSLAQAAFPTIKKTARNPHLKNRYTPLDQLIKQTRPTLQQFGLVILQPPARCEGGFICVRTILAHIDSGEMIESELVLPIKPDKVYGDTYAVTPQGAGSAITYGRRYGYAAILGLASETDDDGNNLPASYEDEPERRQAPQKAAAAKPEGKKETISAHGVLIELPPEKFFNTEPTEEQLVQLSTEIAKANLKRNHIDYLLGSMNLSGHWTLGHVTVAAKFLKKANPLTIADLRDTAEALTLNKEKK